MTISLDKTITQNFDEASHREWLETNGLGGWASSTISGANTRRYHGLLVAATKPPVGRLVLLSKLEETIIVDGNRYELATNRFPGTLHPRGYEFLQSFSKDLFPQFDYEIAGVRLRKTIAAVNGENTTLVLYETADSPAECTLELRPFIAGRDYHSLTRANDAIRRDARFEEGLLQVQPYDGVPDLFVLVPGSVFHHHPEWYYNFEYGVEEERGLDFREDLFTYGVFSLSLKPGETLGIIVSISDPAGRDATKLLALEERRRRNLFRSLPVKDDLAKTLALAADQFVVRRGEDLRTLIAGYHWFSDWGRDTMIALPGICLVTGRFEDAKKILRAFGQSVSKGMLPNRFPDAGEQPEYNTVDATLWFFVAAYRYYQYTADTEFIRSEILPVLHDIIAWHTRGTRYNIHVAEDGLLYAGEAGVQLTWMDAKIGNWVVTPRQGKAVEINALWYNALRIVAELEKDLGDKQEAADFMLKAGKMKERFFEVFWNEAGEYLYDYVDGDHREAEIRPNQVFALSLPFALLADEYSQKILRIVSERLLTPVGLRSLDPEDPAYRPTYAGDQFSRDSAYHQGTVWSWLLGPFVTALVRVVGEQGKMRSKEILEAFRPHLEEAGIGTVSEIFDASAPHAPRGCIAQAWSIGELLRAYVEDVLGRTPESIHAIRARKGYPSKGAVPEVSMMEGQEKE